MLAIRAVGAGGGSIAGVVDGKLQVGPNSAGALPGPACFDRGGTEPTVTDANVVLGLLDPNYFLGGAAQLDAEKARAAIERHVAQPLGISIEDAAWRVVGMIENTMGTALADIRAQAKAGDDALLVVYGGGGPLHSCSVAAQAGINRIVITPFSAVFSAYSSSLMDIGHLYHHRADVKLRPVGDLNAVEPILAALKLRAESDMRGEGVDPGELHWAVELIIESIATGDEIKLLTTPDFHRDHKALESLTQAAAAELSHDPACDLVITSLGLCATAPVAHYRLQPVPLATHALSTSRKGMRRLYMGPQGWNNVEVYDRARLGHGHNLSGPAFVESAQTTVFVPQDWTLSIDRFNNIVVERTAS